MKTNNVIFGKGSGRVGATLNRIVHGVQIEGAMPAKMTNPNTDAQQDTRARFKLASQLSAIMKNVIAIPRDGLKSGRNIFTSKVFEITELVDGIATVDLNKVQLTNGIRPFGALKVDRGTDNENPSSATIEIKQGVFDQVIMCAFRKDNEDNLIFLDSSIKDIEPDDTERTFDVKYTPDAFIVYVYGITYKNSGYKGKYSNVGANPAEYFARIVSSQKNFNSQAKFSATLGVTLLKGQNSMQGGSIVPWKKMFFSTVHSVDNVLVNEDGAIISNGTSYSAESLMIVKENGHILIKEVPSELSSSTFKEQMPDGASTSHYTSGENGYGYFFNGVNDEEYIIYPQPAES